jgi:hypothetical protein
MKSLRLPRRSLAVLAWMALSSAILPLFAADPAADMAAIRSILKAAFDRPDAPLAVEPVTVGTSHAVAGWRQGARGGRALLREHGGTWSVVLCSGDPLRHEAGLVEAGVPADEARMLAAGIASAEAKLDDETRGLLSTFEGTVNMTAHPHSPHHP